MSTADSITNAARFFNGERHFPPERKLEEQLRETIESPRTVRANNSYIKSSSTLGEIRFALAFVVERASSV